MYGMLVIAERHSENKKDPEFYGRICILKGIGVSMKYEYKKIEP